MSLRFRDFASCDARMLRFPSTLQYPSLTITDPLERARLRHSRPSTLTIGMLTCLSAATASNYNDNPNSSYTKPDQDRMMSIPFPSTPPMELRASGP